MKIKKSAVAGLFYPEEKSEIQMLFSEYKKYNSDDVNYNSRLVIAPHAGYVYSGYSTYLSLSHLSGKNIFIFAPAHKIYVHSAVIPDYDMFETPMGRVNLNKEILSKITQEFHLVYNNKAFDTEHAIEVMLPFLSHFKTDFSIVPVLVGDCNANLIEEIISRFFSDTSNSFIISTDLSHFLSNNHALKLDNLTADTIETNDFNNLRHRQACNSVSVCAALKFASENNFSFIRLDMRNSSSVTNDMTSVVGYGSWLMYDGEKNKYIKKYYSDELKDICLNSIVSKGKYSPVKYPIVLNQKGSCFITLEKEGQLRGCIGSIIPYRSLINDLLHNAFASAYNDPRFKPVLSNGIKNLQIKISLLSIPIEISFSDEGDLLDKIVPFEDGIIISDKNYRAVYLPSVWEQLPDKKTFLTSLKRKAGLTDDYFSDTFRAFRFHCEII